MLLKSEQQQQQHFTRVYTFIVKPQLSRCMSKTLVTLVSCSPPETCVQVIRSSEDMRITKTPKLKLSSMTSSLTLTSWRRTTGILITKLWVTQVTNWCLNYPSSSRSITWLLMGSMYHPSSSIHIEVILLVHPGAMSRHPSDQFKNPNQIHLLLNRSVDEGHLIW